MRRRLVWVGIMGGALIAMAQRGPSAFALPPDDNGSCLELSPNHYGCCGYDTNSTAVMSPDLPGGWGCACNPGYRGVAEGNSSRCELDPGGFGGDNNGGNPGDPGGTPGGGGHAPGDGEPDCVEAPMVAGVSTFDMSMSDKPVLFTDAERAQWDDDYKKNPPPPKACKDKKKEKCAACAATYKTDKEFTKKKWEECMSDLNNEANEGCHRGILADGRLAPGASEAEACFQAHHQHWVNSCPSGVPEGGADCSIDFSTWPPEEVCEPNHTAWNECRQTYYRGSGASTEEVHASGEVKWDPIKDVEVSLGAGASVTVKWGPQMGGKKKCDLMAEARTKDNNKRSSDCAKKVNNQFQGGTQCYPP